MQSRETKRRNRVYLQRPCILFSKNVSLELTSWRTRSWEEVQIALMANFTRFAFRTSIKSFLDNWFPNKKDDHRTY